METLISAVGSGNVSKLGQRRARGGQRTAWSRFFWESSSALVALTLILTTGCNAPKDVGERESALSGNPRAILPL